MSGGEAHPARAARSIILAALLLGPGIVIAAMELRHPLRGPELVAALDDAVRERGRLADTESLLQKLEESKRSLNARIHRIAGFKRDQANPAAAITEAGRAVPRGFAVSRLIVTRDRSAGAGALTIRIEGDPTDADAAAWAASGERLESGGHVVEMSFTGDGDPLATAPESTWW